MICTVCHKDKHTTYESRTLGETSICLGCARREHPNRVVGLSVAFPSDVVAHDDGNLSRNHLRR